jgi:hypothetical protein
LNLDSRIRVSPGQGPFPEDFFRDSLDLPVRDGNGLRAKRDPSVAKILLFPERVAPSPEGRLNSAEEMAPSGSEQWLLETVISMRLWENQHKAWPGTQNSMDFADF